MKLISRIPLILSLLLLHHSCSSINLPSEPQNRTVNHSLESEKLSHYPLLVILHGAGGTGSNVNPSIYTELLCIPSMEIFHDMENTVVLADTSQELILMEFMGIETSDDSESFLKLTGNPIESAVIPARSLETILRGM